ncbi:MAG TPA: hypothetical protein VN890_06895 [Methylocella sp.]|nr:hypothetical protein [Methylocella sp.]
MTHKPNETTRRLVVALASVGTQQDRIARMIGVAPGTLRKAYQSELQDGLAHAVASAAQNMFRLALKQSSTGFMAARHVLRCFGGPAWKDTANINLNPGAAAEAYLVESAPADIRERILARLAALNPPEANARDIIADRLSKLASRNAEIYGREGADPPEPL